MDINRIALYLAGKLPPYYQASFDKLELIELIRGQSSKGFSDDFFKIIDSEGFYSMCLNRVRKADIEGFKAIIAELKIPEDAGGLTKQDLQEERLKELKVAYKKIDNLTKNQDKGYAFEKWLMELFSLFGLNPRASYKTKTDQIDGSFELDGKEYLLEAKWTIKPTDKNIVDILFGKLDRTLIGTVGLIISKSGFNKNAIDVAKRHKNLLLMSEKDLQVVFEGKKELGELIRNIRRRMAEEGKPYLG